MLEKDGGFYRLPATDWDCLINRDDLFASLQRAALGAPTVQITSERLSAALLPPIGTQEVWAGGVAYTSSRAASISEAEATGAMAFYRKIYYAERPQLFFKAPHYRVAGPGQPIRIRRDSSWTFPEPELTLFATSSGKIVAYTIGNDMSSGSIEGENPLYLPQAKTHDLCAALGPCLLVMPEPISPETRIGIAVERAGEKIFAGQTQLKFMRRHFPELISYLFRETSFSQGVFLMTGAGVVPPPEMTLQNGDSISITIEGIGTLSNVATARAAEQNLHTPAIL